MKDSFHIFSTSDQSKINNRHSTIVNESSSGQRGLIEDAPVFPKGAPAPKR